MLTMKILFWIFLFILFYSYIGYGMLLWILLKFKKRPNELRNTEEKSFEPMVTLLVAAYNEESIIEEKIANTLALAYPEDKLELYFIADGSDDNTVSIIERYPRIKLFYQKERAGKIAAMNRAVKEVTAEISIFSDANTLLNKNSIKELVKHYANPVVGAVAGEKKVVDASDNTQAAGAGEGLYWKYESYLKKLDSDFNTVVGAAGELFSVRTHLFEPVHSNILLDDFIISMKICMQGYKVVYEPAAFATEAPSFNMREEEKRKIRISAGGFQSIAILKPLLNIFKYGKLSFQYISHRVLRWAVCPLLLPLCLILNLIIVIKASSIIYMGLAAMQLIFYFMALIGFIYARLNLKQKFFYIPYYFVFMNLALYKGYQRFRRNKQSVLWEKAVRKAYLI